MSEPKRSDGPMDTTDLQREGEKLEGNHANQPTPEQVPEQGQQEALTILDGEDGARETDMRKARREQNNQHLNTILTIFNKFGQELRRIEGLQDIFLREATGLRYILYRKQIRSTTQEQIRSLCANFDFSAVEESLRVLEQVKKTSTDEDGSLTALPNVKKAVALCVNYIKHTLDKNGHNQADSKVFDKKLLYLIGEVNRAQKYLTMDRVEAQAAVDKERISRNKHNFYSQIVGDLAGLIGAANAGKDIFKYLVNNQAEIRTLVEHIYLVMTDGSVEMSDEKRLSLWETLEHLRRLQGFTTTNIEPPVWSIRLTQMSQRSYQSADAQKAFKSIPTILGPGLAVANELLNQNRISFAEYTAPSEL